MFCLALLQWMLVVELVGCHMLIRHCFVGFDNSSGIMIPIAASLKVPWKGVDTLLLWCVGCFVSGVYWMLDNEGSILNVNKWAINYGEQSFDRTGRKAGWLKIFYSFYWLDCLKGHLNAWNHWIFKAALTDFWGCFLGAVEQAGKHWCAITI